ncbi:helix-turn-helix domain-containing protein [Streptomyces sp. NPDC002669]|uniref:AraC-like ligand-binding domain-containing protein n=1 Tax=unclassified Streptomyces TaxID=2593676 RepID=UPI00368B80C8
MLNVPALSSPAGGIERWGISVWQGVTAAEVPAHDRLDWFVETVSSALMPSKFTAHKPAAFEAEGAFLEFGSVQLSRFSYSPLRSRRTPALIRRGDPEQYQLGLVTRGSAWYAQGGGEAELHGGDMLVWDTSLPYESGSGLDGKDVEVLVLHMPKEHKLLGSQQVWPLLGRCLDSRTGIGAVLSQFLLSVAANGSHCGPQELSSLGHVAMELATSCLVQQSGAEAELPELARAHVLLRQIYAYIGQNLADPGLSPRAIAERHHISLRSLYTLFRDHAEDHGQGEGVAAVIRRHRLERCRADLVSPHMRRHPVHVIAARWGFTNASTFSRSFRAAYGITPQDYRFQSERVDSHD